MTKIILQRVKRLVIFYDKVFKYVFHFVLHILSPFRKGGAYLLVRDYVQENTSGPAIS